MKNKVGSVDLFEIDASDLNKIYQRSVKSSDKTSNVYIEKAYFLPKQNVYIGVYDSTDWVEDEILFAINLIHPHVNAFMTDSVSGEKRDIIFTTHLDKDYQPCIDRLFIEIEKLNIGYEKLFSSKQEFLNVRESGDINLYMHYYNRFNEIIKKQSGLDYTTFNNVDIEFNAYDMFIREDLMERSKIMYRGLTDLELEYLFSKKKLKTEISYGENWFTTGLSETIDIQFVNTQFQHYNLLLENHKQILKTNVSNFLKTLEEREYQNLLDKYLIKFEQEIDSEIEKEVIVFKELFLKEQRQKMFKEIYDEDNNLICYVLNDVKDKFTLDLQEMYKLFCEKQIIKVNNDDINLLKDVLKQFDNKTSGVVIYQRDNDLEKRLMV
jgi:hypothetical protein